MSDIFISYSRKDEEFSRQIAISLKKAGYDVWIDIEDISSGIKWSTAIQHGLDACDLLVVIISPDSMASVNVEDEWQYFIDQGKPLVPILWRSAKIHFQLNRLQYIDFEKIEFDVAFKRLISEIGTKLPLMFEKVTLQDVDAEHTREFFAEVTTALPKSVSLTDISKVDTTEEITRRWNASAGSENAYWPHVPIAVTANSSRALHLSADGDGIHGLVVGDVGSGKSEFIASFIASCALHYDPRMVNFVYFGHHYEFSQFETIPHYVNRYEGIDDICAIKDEIERRRDLIVHYNVRHIVEYHQHGLSRENSDPFAHLFCIVGNADKLLDTSNEAAESLLWISRMGRAVGVYLILVSSDSDLHRFENLLPNVKWYICFRTHDAELSQFVLGSSEATNIPTDTPGRAYLRVGNDQPELIQIAYSGKFWGYAGNDEEALINSEMLSEISIDIPKQKETWLPPFVSLETLLQAKGDNRLTRIREADKFVWKNHDNGTVMEIGLLSDPLGELFTIDISQENCLVLSSDKMERQRLIETAILSLSSQYSPDNLEILLFCQNRELDIFKRLPHCPTEVDESNLELQDITKLVKSNPGKKKILIIEHLSDFMSKLKDKDENLQEVLDVLFSQGSDISCLVVDQYDYGREKLYSRFLHRIACKSVDESEYVFIFGKQLLQLHVSGRAYYGQSNSETQMVQIAFALDTPSYNRSSDNKVAAAQFVKKLIDGYR